jgi:molybdate transport system regulatory protein
MTKSIGHILKKRGTYRINGSLWMEFEEDRFFGPGRVELLERIDQSGSINQAAMQMRMSYKKAWDMVTMVNTQSRHPLVILHVGGERGGGAEITNEARELIAYHRLLRKRFTSFLEKETKRLNNK